MLIRRDETVIRSMSLDELETVIGWAENEGWNPGKYDHHAYYALDKNGHFILLDKNKPIGSISVVRYSNDFCFIGLFIVLPEFRSKGYGKQLWDYAMNYIANTLLSGLYAVPQQISRYKKSGFNEKYTNNRWSRIASNPPEQTEGLIDQSKNPHTMFERLCQYDLTIFGHQRSKIFNKMLTLPMTWAFVTLDTSTGKVNGYGLIRPCKRGYRIGPLYSDSFENAKIIFRILLAKIPGERVIIDIPTVNSFNKQFADYFSLEHISAVDTVAMFKGSGALDMDQSKCYGVYSLEIG